MHITKIKYIASTYNGRINHKSKKIRKISSVLKSFCLSEMNAKKKSFQKQATFPTGNLITLCMLVTDNSDNIESNQEKISERKSS